MPRHCQAEFTDLWDVLYLHTLISFFVIYVFLKRCAWPATPAGLHTPEVI
jgi:hypothetical protein